MLAAQARPTGNHRDQLRAGEGGGAEQLGEAQVVTDERGDAHALPLEQHVTGVAGGVVDVLAGRGEGLLLEIAGEQGAIGGEGDRFIGQLAGGARAGDAAGEDRDPSIDRELAAECLGGRRRARVGPGRVHAEADVEHFRQHDQRVARSSKRWPYATS